MSKVDKYFQFKKIDEFGIVLFSSFFNAQFAMTIYQLEKCKAPEEAKRIEAIRALRDLRNQIDKALEEI